MDSVAEELEPLVDTLQRASLDVVGVSSAEELLECFEPGGPACVVTELELPGLGGLELQVRLRAISPDTTFVFFTRDPDVPTAVAALQGGAVDYLEKFWLGSGVVKRVRTALEESRRRVDDTEARFRKEPG